MKPVLDPVQALAQQVETFDEFRAGLAGLLDQMDDSTLIQRLALAAFKARAKGDVSDTL